MQLFWQEAVIGRRKQRINKFLNFHKPVMNCWQAECHLFTFGYLLITEVLPSIGTGSRPARLVMVATDF